MTDWDKIKSDFEVLGLGLQELAEAHQVDIGILEMAQETQDWVDPTRSAPTASDAGATPMVVDADENERILVAHQATILPKYMDVELLFLNKLKGLIGSIVSADEAKKIAETLTAIRPPALQGADEGAGGFKLIIQNQFPVPQPGDDAYIPPNAVIIGEEARRGTDCGEVVGTDYTSLEIDMGEYPN